MSCSLEYRMDGGPDVETPKKRIGSFHGGGSHCDSRGIELVYKIFTYDLLELFAAVDVYHMLQQNPDVVTLAWKSESGHINQNRVENARTEYFGRKDVALNDNPADRQAVGNIYPMEWLIFDRLSQEVGILESLLKEPKPSTQEELQTRLLQTLPDRYYLLITSCAGHYEQQLQLARSARWEYSYHDIEAEDTVTIRVPDHCLFVAPQRQIEPKILLSDAIASALKPRAEEMLRLMQQAPVPTLKG